MLAEARTQADGVIIRLVSASRYRAGHALQKQEASGPASANAREMWERPQGRGAFLVISLETRVARILETKRDGRVSQVGEKIARASREKKLFVLCKSYNVREEGPHFLFPRFSTMERQGVKELG